MVGLALAIGLACWQPRYRAALFLDGVVGILLLANALLVGEVPRYRYPLDPLITILAAGSYLAALPALLRAVRHRAPVGGTW